MSFALPILICLAAAMPAPVTGQKPDKYEGRRIQEVLRQLQTEGLRIIFSDTLVSPDLRVKREPRGRVPRDIAEEILSPHGLALAEGPADTWLVVRVTNRGKAPPQPAKPPPKRPATSEPSAPPPERPAIRLEEKVDVVDRFGDFAGQKMVPTLDSRRVLETAGGLENVFHVLPLLPGVAATDDQQGTLAVRGAGPEHNVVVFDGVQIHSPQRIGDWGTSFANPTTIGSIALDASGLDARYGGRLSSVTVIETRDGTTERTLAVSAAAGLTSGDVLLEGRLPRTASGSWWATARGTYYKYVAERFRDGEIPGFVDVQFKLTAHPSSHTRLTLLGLVGNETMARPLAGGDSRYITGNISRQFSADNRIAVANLWWTPGARLTTTTTLTAYTNASRYQDHWRLRLTGPFDRQVRVDDFALRQRVLLKGSRGYVTDAGIEARRLQSRWHMTGMIPAPNQRAVGPDTWGGWIEYDGPIDSRLARSQLGAWLQQRIPIGELLTVEPGMRVDWNSITGENALQPRLRVSRTMGRGTIWSGVAWQAQTPGHETMHQGIPYYTLTGAEASNLRNERSRQIVVGLEREFGGGASLRIEAYRRAFDHLLVQRLETEAERQRRLSRYEIPADLPADSAILEYRPTVDPESTGTGRATGLEVLLQRGRGRLTGWLSYALSKSERELYGRIVPFDFDRRHAAGAVLNVDLSKRIRLSARSQYASGFPVTPLHREVYFGDTVLPTPLPPFRAPRPSSGQFIYITDPNNYLRVSLLNSARMPAYARTDVRVTVGIAKWLEAYGEIINVFNRENYHPIATFGFGEVPGQYEVARNLPLLPTYGVRVKF